MVALEHLELLERLGLLGHLEHLLERHPEQQRWPQH